MATVEAHKSLAIEVATGIIIRWEAMLPLPLLRICKVRKRPWCAHEVHGYIARLEGDRDMIHRVSLQVRDGNAARSACKCGTATLPGQPASAGRCHREHAARSLGGEARRASESELSLLTLVHVHAVFDVPRGA